MTDDFENTHRELGKRQIAAGEAFTVRLRRRYDSPIDDVWSAFTEPDRLKRWSARYRRSPARRHVRPGGQRPRPDPRV